MNASSNAHYEWFASFLQYYIDYYEKQAKKRAYSPGERKFKDDQGIAAKYLKLMISEPACRAYIENKDSKGFIAQYATNECVQVRYFIFAAMPF